MANAEETACFIAAARERDKEMNKLYQQVLRVAQPQIPQRAWLRFRDASCNAEKDMYDGGSAQPMVYYACLEAETRYRINDLKDTYGWRIEKFR